MTGLGDIGYVFHAPTAHRGAVVRSFDVFGRARGHVHRFVLLSNYVTSPVTVMGLCSVIGVVFLVVGGHPVVQL